MYMFACVCVGVIVFVCVSMRVCKYVRMSVFVIVYKYMFVLVTLTGVSVPMLEPSKACYELLLWLRKASSIDYTV